MSKFLITGGLQRANATGLGEGRRFKQARLLKVDFSSGSVEQLLAYNGTPDNYPDEEPNVLFTAATLEGGRLYLCSETELFVYSYPDLDLLQQTSLPCWQNVHHVAVTQEYLAVTSTGLDLIVLLDKESLEPVRYLNPEGKDPWHRYSPAVDYRKVHSTKPHDVHPNYVFEIDGQLWTTRFNQRDAICLDDPGKRIDIAVQRPHDGHVLGDHVFFTTVNGCVVVANTQTLKVEEVFDLNEIDPFPGPLGWCRGLALDGDIAYVGFSRLRPTVIKANVKWVLSHLGRSQFAPTRICAYNLRTREKLAEVELAKNMSSAVYSVLPA